MKLSRLFLIYLLLKYRRSIRRRHYIRKSSLLKFSQWQQQIRAQDDLVFIETTGFDWRSFKKLLQLISDQPFWFKAVGNRRILSPLNMLGLVLQWARGSARQSIYCQIFSLSPATVSRGIRQGVNILFEALRRHPLGKISWPTPEEMSATAAVLKKKEPALKHLLFGFVDGFRLKIQDHSDPSMQNAYYNRKYGSNVGNIVAFDHRGLIIYYAVNYPGSWHDARIARKFYELLEDPILTPPQFMMLADEGFTLHGRIVQTKQTPFNNYRTEMEAANVSIRQSVEWGIRGIKSSWPRITAGLRTEFEWNQQLLLFIMHLHNYRTRTVGFNQIRTVFEPFEWEQFRQ